MCPAISLAQSVIQTVPWIAYYKPLLDEAPDPDNADLKYIVSRLDTAVSVKTRFDNLRPAAQLSTVLSRNDHDASFVAVYAQLLISATLRPLPATSWS